MQISNLSLEGFRNYEAVSLDFDPGVNLLLGSNAQGKTNLLEAIFYLSAGHGFRTRKEAELIGFGKDFALLEAKIADEDRQAELRAVLFAGRRPRQLFVNGVESTLNLLRPTKPRCPHLGCALQWNPHEQSWDCPCHGSRFDEDGKLLENPATGDLER